MTLSPEDQRKLIKDLCSRSEVRAKQILQWVQGLDSIAEDILARRDASYPYSLFWIRLWGVVAELAPKTQGMFELLKQVDAVERKRTPVISLIIAQHQAAAALCRALSEDELIYLDYRRYCECHLHQDSYQLGIKQNQLRTTRLFTILGREVPIATLDTRLIAILMKYNVDEKAIAVELAGRLSLKIKALRRAMEQIHALE